MHLGRCFAVDIYAHAVMDNHFHLVVYFDPHAASRWSDEEVAERWFQAFPCRAHRDEDGWARELGKLELIADGARLARCRSVLGSLSSFMQHLKQPIARRANQEDGVSGHFFEKRFYSGALLSENAMLAAMAYVDLNPVRARIARCIEQCKHTSIAKRLQVVENDPARLAQELAPIAAGVRSAESGSDAAESAWEALPWSLASYLEHLQALVEAYAQPDEARSDAELRWIKQVASLKKRQRAYGDSDRLRDWTTKRNMRRLEKPLP